VTISVGPVDLRVAPAHVFSAALGGSGLTAVVEGLGHEHKLPVARWAGHASRGDRFLLDRCRGATVDVGCGPGRLAEELAARGHDVLGVDASEVAVAKARRRGVTAMHRDVFEPLPGEGRWDTALLADGNIGIGGDPVALLRRVGRLVHAGGRVVLDLAPAGTGLRVHRIHLRAGGLWSTSFPWAVLGPEALDHTCAHAGLVATEVSRRRGRWVAVLAREVASP
jgi:SAM-dependent methyltransferase